MGASGLANLPDGATSALSLTFDGGFVDHVELVAPMLAEANVRATFFVPVAPLLDRPRPWRQIAEAGHEIANHAHFGVSDEGSLDNWELDAVRADLMDANLGIGAVTGFLPTSFAMSGVSTRCANGDYARDLVAAFAAIRSAEVGSNDISATNPRDVRCLPWNLASGAATQLLPTPGEWTVPVFSRFFDPQFDAAEEDLRSLLAEIAHRPEIWVAPFGEVAARLTKLPESR